MEVRGCGSRKLAHVRLRDGRLRHRNRPTRLCNVALRPRSCRHCACVIRVRLSTDENADAEFPFWFRIRSVKRNSGEGFTALSLVEQAGEINHVRLKKDSGPQRGPQWL